jgi:hypothetical protein
MQIMKGPKVCVLPSLKIAKADNLWVWFFDVTGIEDMGLMDDAYIKHQIGVDIIEDGRSANQQARLLSVSRLSSDPHYVAARTSKIYVCNGATGTTIECL